jgi:hypothetical protein
MSSPHVARALRFFETHADAITEEHIRICSIPASPFGEQERAEYLSRKFAELGLTEVEIDEEGRRQPNRKPYGGEARPEATDGSGDEHRCYEEEKWCVLIEDRRKRQAKRKRDELKPKRSGTIFRYVEAKAGEQHGHYVVRCSAPDNSRPLFHLDLSPKSEKARLSALRTAEASGRA